MHVLKYYHVDHKDKWHIVPESQIPVNAKYESVMYLKYRAEDVEASGEQQEYWGPMYIDLDSEDVLIALADMREILTYLDLNFNIQEPNYRIYASGSKGFHLEINPYLYMDGKFKVALPLRYRAMAARIKQDLGDRVCIDMGVYSQGKGRQWRRPNVKRENGNYKVWLPRAEFNKLDLDKLNDVVKQPGLVAPIFEKVMVNELLKSWFESTKKLVEMAKPSKPVPDNVILDTETPECVVKLARNKDVKGNVNSNLLAMQAISYGIARAWNVDQIISYNREFINNYRSSQYKTAAAFEDHFRGLYDYASEAPDKFKFGCKMMLSCVDSVDCNSCAIKIGEDAENMVEGIIVKDGHYYLIPDDPDQQPRKLSNFTIDLRSMTYMESELYSEEPPVLDIKFSSPKNATRGLWSESKKVKQDLFASKQAFTKILSLELAYFGSDKDLQMLKLAIMHASDPKKILQVEYTGLYWKNDEWHFVTKDGSMSLNGTIDLIKTTAGAAAATKTKLNFESERPPRPDEIIKYFDTLAEINSSIVTVPLITWFFGAFFSPHCMTMNEPAPSLFVTGSHGAGKTQSILQMHRLFAPDRPSFPSISSTTAFSMNKFCSSTNLMPLIFDEFKPSANTSKRGEEGQVSQAIRASYNKGYESRGTKNRTVEETPFLAPIGFIGEQQINEGAVQDRIVLVHMDKATHSRKRSDALEDLKRLDIEVIGAHFLEFAMRVRPEEFVNKVLSYDKQLEDKYNGVFDNRPRRNLANLMTVMDLIEQYVLLYTSDESLVEKLAGIMNEYVSSFNSHSTKVYNEMRGMDDTVQSLNSLNDLADLINPNLGDLALMRNRQYTIEDGILYIDVAACYTNLSIYIQKNRLNLYLTDKSSFLMQLNQKNYVTKKMFKSDKIISGRQRMLVGINLELAEASSVVLDNFSRK